MRGETELYRHSLDVSSEAQRKRGRVGGTVAAANRRRLRESETLPPSFFSSSLSFPTPKLTLRLLFNQCSKISLSSTEINPILRSRSGTDVSRLLSS